MVLRTLTNTKSIKMTKIELEQSHTYNCVEKTFNQSLLLACLQQLLPEAYAVYTVGAFS